MMVSAWNPSFFLDDIVGIIFYLYASSTHSSLLSPTLLYVVILWVLRAA
jgi:hypothetical protein